MVRDEGPGPYPHDEDVCGIMVALPGRLVRGLLSESWAWTIPASARVAGL